MLKYSRIYAQRYTYYPWLFAHYDFLLLLSERWREARPRLEEMHAYIDSVATLLAPSEALDSRMWPITTTINDDESLSFAEAVERMHQFIDVKLASIGDYINLTASGIADLDYPSEGQSSNGKWSDGKWLNGKWQNGKCYDLTGRRLAVPPARGLYIEYGQLRVKH